MKKIINKIEGLINYPITAFWALILIIYINSIDKYFIEDNTLGAFIVVGLISTGLGYTIFENKKFIHLKVLGVSAFYSGLSYLLVGVGDLNVRNQKMIAGILGIIIFIFFAKLLRDGLNFNNIFINYIIHLGIGAFATILFAALIAITYELFRININFKIVTSIWVVIFTVIFTLFYTTRKKIESKAINNIFSIFILAFITILYMGLFSNKQSIMMHLILWLGYMMAGLNTVIKKKYVPVLTLPLVGYMIYIAIRQIAIYDVTENRYFILAFGIFLLIVLLLQLFKDIETVNYAKAFVAFIAIVFFIPYYNAFSLTERRMVNNFKTLQSMENITDQDEETLSSYYYYLTDRDIKLEEFKKYEEKEGIDSEVVEVETYENVYVKQENGSTKIANLIYLQEDIYEIKKYEYTIKGKNVDILEKLVKKEYETEDYTIHPIKYSIDKGNKSGNYSGYFEILIEIK